MSGVSEEEIAKAQRERLASQGALAGFGSKGSFDKDIYDADNKDSFSSHILEEQNGQAAGSLHTKSKSQMSSYKAKNLALEDTKGSDTVDPFEKHRLSQGSSRVSDRDNEYTARRFNRDFSPERVDPFADQTPAPDQRSYTDVMMEEQLAREEQRVLREIEKKKKEVEEKAASLKRAAEENQEDSGAPARKRGRWDAPPPSSSSSSSSSSSRWDATPMATDEPTDDSSASKSSGSRWDQTPVAVSSSSSRSSRWDQTPVVAISSSNSSRWDQTPVDAGSAGASSSSGRKRSRWDQTPVNIESGQGPLGMQTPGATPVGQAGMMTPTPSQSIPLGEMTPMQITQARAAADIQRRNRPMTDEELDEILPGEAEGFEICVPPEGYAPIRTQASKLMMTPTPMGNVGFQMPSEVTENAAALYDIPDIVESHGVTFTKPEDHQHFGKLLETVDENELNKEELIEREIMVLLLKVKNGTPPQRKTALKRLTNKARIFGAGPLMNQILPLLMSPTLEDQERHLLVKVIDRVLFKLDDLIRPYVHKILVVIEPLLIDEDYYARVEGREIISNLSKAAGLATMIATMRPDIDNVDEFVRNTTARAFAVVASALGIHSLLPFLKAVCQSKRSWQARHTGIKICQQIAILMGCAVLPHLRSIVEIIEHGLEDEQSKVRCICALALAALAEAAAPYGIEAFDSVLRPLWKGIRSHRNKTLAAFLKAIGHIIPLMDAGYARYYTKEVMVILIREFASTDEEMKKIVLKVVKQCVSTDGVEVDYVKEEILPPFFRNFWVRRMALDRRNYRQLVSTSVALAEKVGGGLIIGKVVEDLKDESEPYRRMVMETIRKILSKLGSGDVDQRLEELLIDGILYAFQEQASDDTRTMLDGFGVVVNSLGTRCKNYLPQVCGIIKWRLNNKAARVRQQAADLIARIAVVMKKCGEMQMLNHLGVVLYEYLGEEYPDVLGSILGALKAVVNVVGMERMTPPIKDLVPRLAPILKNRHEKVQENCIDLVGRIADRGAEYVSPKEWMRICFELLEMLKAHKKAIRRATVNTFGYIAKAIGPQDVLATLLNNLKVQERQNRVCTTVAIAIVAETCSPFTVLPALMNEYRVPDLNVQNGVLKALSFMFEYIGEMGRDYVYATTPLLEDALMDRDAIHRQTAASVVKHLSLGVAGLGREDAMQHLLNFVWPNIFESVPHLITCVMEAIEGLTVALGPTKILQYTLQGLFHPARKVRTMYWKIFNTLYIRSQDSLVPSWPRLDDDKLNNNHYRRHEMEIFI